jgi:hypothetical protein
MKTYTEAEMREAKIKAFCQGVITLCAVGFFAYLLGR